MTDHTGQRPIGYIELIRGHANFRRLWIGQIISLLGDWFNLIASAALIVSLTGSGLAVGSLFVVRMLAPFLVSPLAGVVADRYDRRRVLIAADIGRAAVVCGFLLVREPGDVWLLYALTALQLGIGGFFFPARNAILPDVVPARAVGTANAISSATWSVMLALGAALGGLVSGIWGIYPAFAIDALTFLVSAAVIARIRLERGKERHEGERTVGAVLEEYLDGLRYLRRHAGVAFTAHHKAAMILCFGGAMEVIQVAISRQVFSIGVDGGIGLGLMYAMAGVGSGLGPIAARHFTGDRLGPLRLAIAGGYVLAFLGLLIVSSLESFAVVLGGILLRSLGSGIIWVLSSQILLQSVSGQVRGRVFATEHALFTLAGAAGAGLGGQLLDMADIGPAVRVLAFTALIPAVLWSLWIARGEREARGG